MKTNEETTDTEANQPPSDSSAGQICGAAHCSTLPFGPDNSPGEKKMFLHFTATLPDDRSVSVGYSATGSRSVTINRKNEEGKTVELKFGLTEDAAEALRQAFNKAKFHELSEENPFQSNVPAHPIRPTQRAFSSSITFPPPVNLPTRQRGRICGAASCSTPIPLNPFPHPNREKVVPNQTSLNANRTEHPSPPPTPSYRHASQYSRTPSKKLRITNQALPYPSELATNHTQPDFSPEEHAAENRASF
ncbi:hypothetical protein [Roseibacillus persicicus]|uniref:hypothetical protein n=1 Tax=Roseibacillus persicicus TaxID=454148 RepID=UPI00280C750E|nr:hypothetical protein [Roseibacillus persicicus]MDQ8192681.1 hypothetical protein [Roseibacillus persicicus]